MCGRQAWQKLGAMPAEDAMQQYIDIVTDLYPTWAAGSALVRIFFFFFLAFLYIYWLSIGFSVFLHFPGLLTHV